MGNYFAKKGGQVTEADKAVLTLKTQRRKLTAERKRLEDLITREVQLARQLVAQKRQSQALIALKKKKVQEGRVDNIDKWLLNVEETLANIETAKRNNQLFSALKQGHKALTELQQEVTIEDAERLMDDSAEAKAYQDRMSETLSQSLTPEEDEAVHAELDAMEANSLQEQMDALPEVPKHTVPVQEKAEAEEHAQPTPLKARLSQAMEEPIAAS